MNQLNEVVLPTVREDGRGRGVSGLGEYVNSVNGALLRCNSLPPWENAEWYQVSVGPRVVMKTSGNGVPCPGEWGCPRVGSGEPPQVEGETEYE